MMIKAADPVYKRISKILPSQWSQYIEKTTSLADETKMEERRWKLLFKNYSLRLILFSIILSAILALSAYFIKPFVHEHIPNMFARIVVTTITLIIMAPFLKALIGWETIIPIYFKEKLATFLCKFTHKSKQEETRQNLLRKLETKFGFCHVTGETENIKNFFVSNQKIAALYFKLWTSKKLNRLPLILLTSFRLLVVMFFIVIAIHQFLTENPRVTMIMLIISILVLFQSKWLFNQYMKIETQFLINLKGRRALETLETEKVPSLPTTSEDNKTIDK